MRIFGKKEEQGTGGGQFRIKDLVLYYLGYTVIFCVMAAAVFVWFWLTRRRLVWKTDGVNQHYYGLLYFARWGREVLAQFRETGVLQLPTFTLRTGYGEDLYTTLAYYVIGDPFSFPAVFVPEKYLLAYHDLMLLVRFYLAGITFSAYCFYMKRRSRLSVLAGALIYIFNAFTLSGMRHHYFLNPFVFFPLLLIGCERIFRKRKPGLFIFMVFLSAVSNFYFFYMMVLMTVLYAVWRSVRQHGLRHFGRVILDGIAFAWYGLLGTLLASFLFLPVVLRFLQDPRAAEEKSIPWLWPLRYYRNFIDCYLTGATSALADSWTYMGFGAVAALCVLFLFVQRKKHFDLKAAVLGLTALLMTPAAAWVMNGFSYPANRWMFAYALLTGFAAATAIPEMVEDADARQLLSTTALLALLAAVCAAWGYTFARTSAQGVMIALFGLAAVLGGRLWLAEKEKEAKASCPEPEAAENAIRTVSAERQTAGAFFGKEQTDGKIPGRGHTAGEGPDAGKTEDAAEGAAAGNGKHGAAPDGLKRRMSVRVQAVLLACVMVIVAGEAYFAFSPDRNAKVFEYLSRAQIETQTAKDAAAAASLIDEEIPFYRYTAYNPENNTSLLYGVSNTQYYWSLSNAATTQFFNETGQLNRMIHLYDTLDDRTFLNEIAGIRYFLGNDREGLPWGYQKLEGLSYSNEDLWPDNAGLERFSCEVYENRYALPFGFTSGAWISRADYEALDIPQRQEALMQGILLERDPGEDFVKMETAGAEGTENAAAGQAAAENGVTAEKAGAAAAKAGTEAGRKASDGAESGAGAQAPAGNLLQFTDRRLPVQVEFDGTKISAEGLAEVTDRAPAGNASAGNDSAGAGAAGASGAEVSAGAGAAGASGVEVPAGTSGAEVSTGADPAGVSAVGAASVRYAMDGSPAAFHVKEGNQAVTFRFEGLPDCETSLYVKGLSYAPPAGVTGPDSILLSVKGYAGNTELTSKQIGFTTPANPWTTGRKDYQVNMRWHSEPLDRIELSFPETGTFTFDSVEVVCQPMTEYPAQAEELRREVLTDLDLHEMGQSFATERITGHIDLEAPRILCLQIPCTPGWTAYVDGVRTELLQADTMFSALLLPAGSHEISLHYQTPGLRLGALLSAGTLLLILLFGILYAIVLAVLGHRDRRREAVPVGSYTPAEEEMPPVSGTGRSGAEAQATGEGETAGAPAENVEPEDNAAPVDAVPDLKEKDPADQPETGEHA